MYQSICINREFLLFNFSYLKSRILLFIRFSCFMFVTFTNLFWNFGRVRVFSCNSTVACRDVVFTINYNYVHSADLELTVLLQIRKINSPNCYSQVT